MSLGTIARALGAVSLPILISVAACGPLGDDRDPEGSDGQQVDPVPSVVNEAIRADFPADGEVHVLLSRGRFSIGPDTLFCESAPDADAEMISYGVSGVNLGTVRQNLEAMEQAYHLNGSSRQRPTRAPGCDRTGTILHRGYVRTNRTGRPFEAILAVWQNDAVWVGAIARDLDPQDSASWGDLPYRKGGPQLVDAILPELEKLSKASRDHLFVGK